MRRIFLLILSLIIFFILFTGFIGRFFESNKGLHVQDIRIINASGVLLKNINVRDKNNKTSILKAGTNVKLIRNIKTNEGDYYLLVNSGTLETFLAKKSDVTEDNFRKLLHDKDLLAFLLSKYKNSVVKNLAYNINSPGKKIKVALTIDMCPANNRQFEKEYLFNWLARLSIENKVQIPVGIAITKKWISSYPDDFKQLLKWQSDKNIKITWINHSSSHPLNEDSSHNFLFLTAKNVNFEKEILDVERALLENNQIPSVFFRFPGLVYNERLLKKLNEFSLIPINSNTWINKGQQIKNLSIVLVHGNGNEHPGIIKFRKEVEILQKSGLFDVHSFVDIGKSL